MKRIHKLTAAGTAAAALWGAALRLELPERQHQLLLLSPLLLAAAFGCYLLVLLVVGVLSFRTCPEEATALHEDIRRAKKELAARGCAFASG